MQDRELSAILVEALPSKEEAEDLAATSFSNAISDKGVEVSKEEIAEYGSEDALRGACLDFAVHGSAHYVEKSAPRVNPTFVEKKVVYERPLEDHAVIGYIDLVEGEEGDRTIADLKTSEKRPSAWAAEDSGQLSTYATLWKLVMGELPKKLRLEYLVRTKKTKTTSMQRLETERNDGDVEATLNILDAAVQTVEAGAYMPTNPDNWWCSRKFCEYYSDCRFVNPTR